MRSHTTINGSPDIAAEEGNFTSSELNAIESLVLADRENVHSAMLAWLLRSPALSLPARRALLRALAGPLDVDPTPIATTTEWRDLDILVELTSPAGDAAFVAIEHKIKAREGDAQLAAYDQELVSLSAPVVAKVLLSFVGDEPQSGHSWRPCSYADLLDGLDQAVAHGENQHLSDYRALVRRLVACHRLVVHSAAYARHVFGEEAVDGGPTAGSVNYVERCRLRVTLQRAWLAEVTRRAQLSERRWSTKTDESNGVGLADFARVAHRGQLRIRYGVQLQNWQLKAFAQPWPYPKNVSDGERRAVEGVLDEIRDALGIARSARATADRGRGFRSFRIGADRTSRERYDVSSWAVEIARTLASLKGCLMAPNEVMSLATSVARLRLTRALASDRHSVRRTRPELSPKLSRCVGA
ncbi:PD-(D/E)XK nuclease family protein [Sorangium cellulosum]|uniref:PD-(D/E)XK nuclease family protein n=1 Tax=Sorangium cellulosum TaxID=56 RepID=UPI00040EDDD3|nr:PD-(D/E)XK nuclease family protein [Sorangium cellulosum]